MAKSITELMVEKAARTAAVRPTRTYRATVGEGQQYVAEMQALVSENNDLMVQHEAAVEAAMNERPLKMGELPELPDLPQRCVEIRARMAELNTLMGEYEGDLTITGTRTDGDWADWKITHPAREEGEPGYIEDQMISGVCNATALLDDLATYVTHWEGEELAPGQFDALDLMRPDKKAIAGIVVDMYERGVNLPKLRSGLRAILASVPFSSSPENSESASDASTATSRQSGTSTTPSEPTAS
jgi:hypothetical protein